MYKTYSAEHDLPKQIIPTNLMARPETIIPSPAVDLSYQLPTQKLDPSIAEAWEKAMASPFLFIAHALSLASQRRVLNAYFTNAEILSPQHLVRYSPFLILAVRQLISGTLIKINNNEDTTIRTRNGMGFLLKVPSCCLHTISLKDADLPTEQLGISQASFRKLILDKSGTSHLSLNQKNINLTPIDILSSSKDTYNEIAFIPRSIHPNKKITLVGAFINERVEDFGIQAEKGDPSPPKFYYSLMHELSTLLHLPLVCLNGHP